MSSYTPSSGSLRAGLSTQLRVIGATVMREIHTRFGRENIGYIWLFLEPMFLAVGVSLIHVLLHVHLTGDYPVFAFYITGYVPYMIFRGLINRSTAIITSNRPLLYHRQVTLFDIVLARAILELVATFTCAMLLLGISQSFGGGGLPQRPLLFIAGMFLITWYSLSLSMLICSASEFFPSTEHFVHPATYLSLPISGMAFLIEWVPDGLRKYLLLFPLPHIIELLREGEFSSLNSTYINIGYVIAVCAVQTLLGLFALRITRNRMHFA